MESKKGGTQSMSRSVVPLVNALEDEYGSITNVPETNKKLLEIRKRFHEQKRERYEAIIHSLNLGESINNIAKINNVSYGTVYQIKRGYRVKQVNREVFSKPCVLINKKTGKRINFKAIKYIGPAMGYSEGWGYKIKQKGSPRYKIELLPKEKKIPKHKNKV